MSDNTPEIFRQFCSSFHQDISLLYSSIQEVVENFVIQTSELDRKELRKYLDILLSGGQNEEKLQEIWFEGGGTGCFHHTVPAGFSDASA